MYLKQSFQGIEICMNVCTTHLFEYRLFSNKKCFEVDIIYKLQKHTDTSNAKANIIMIKYPWQLYNFTTIIFKEAQTNESRLAQKSVL